VALLLVGRRLALLDGLILRDFRTALDLVVCIIYGGDEAFTCRGLAFLVLMLPTRPLEQRCFIVFWEIADCAFFGSHGVSREISGVPELLLRSGTLSGPCNSPTESRLLLKDIFSEEWVTSPW
jgi:hypothetical protein